MQGLNCLRVFQTIGDTFNSPLETAEMLRSVSRSIVENLSAKGCQFFLLSRDQRQLEIMASFDLSEKFAIRGPLAVEGILGEVLRGDTVLIADCQSDPRVCSFSAYKEEGIKSLLLIPLKSRGQVIGSMHITTAEERTCSSDDWEILRVVAALCTSVILHSMFQNILHHVSETFLYLSISMKCWNRSLE